MLQEAEWEIPKSKPSAYKFDSFCCTKPMYIIKPKFRCTRGRLESLTSQSLVVQCKEYSQADLGSNSSPDINQLYVADFIFAKWLKHHFQSHMLSRGRVYISLLLKIGWAFVATSVSRRMS